LLSVSEGAGVVKYGEEKMTATIWIRNRYEQASVHICDINYIEVGDRKVLVHTSDQILWESCSMDEMLYRIDDRRIYRCHRSLAVNLDHIVSLENGSVTLNNGNEHLMCRGAWQRTKRMLERYRHGTKHDTRTGKDRRKISDRRNAANNDRRSSSDHD
jgi:hypothetical protein